jgi:hypothetical protein
VPYSLNILLSGASIKSFLASYLPEQVGGMASTEE